MLTKIILVLIEQMIAFGTLEVFDRVITKDTANLPCEWELE